jgi:Uma2 family endonuclease
MGFIQGSPTFAAEVRSENDHGEPAEARLADKRTDYFAAGAKVVWDVDPVNDCVHVYRATRPEEPTTYRRGDVAEAEPAVPGWTVLVDSLFKGL